MLGIPGLRFPGQCTRRSRICRPGLSVPQHSSSLIARGGTRRAGGVQGFHPSGLLLALFTEGER
jgi:hypothetical protein